MVACFDLITLDSGPCGECGRAHRFRVTTAADESVAARPLCGFFAACPATRRRAWFVVQLPADELPMRLLETGPADDDSWEPAPAEQPFRAPRPAAATAYQSPIADILLPRGNDAGGFRVPAHTPDRLRRVLGCPHTL